MTVCLREYEIFKIKLYDKTMEKRLTKKELGKLLEDKSKENLGLFERFLEWLEFSYIGLIPYWIWKGYGNNWCGIKYIPKEIKWDFQRLFRGYADSDLWDLDSFLGAHIVKCLKAFNKIKRNSIPANYTCDSDGNKIPWNTAIKNYKKDIKDMIEGFEFLVDKYDQEHDKLLKKYKNDYKKAGEEYNKLYDAATVKAQKFVQHFNSLWD